MKFTSTQENLNQGLSIVSPLASKTTTLPILNNILIQAEKGSLTLVSTNLEIGITYQLRSKIDRDGKYTVQSKVLSDFVNLLPKENVEINLENDMLSVLAGNYKTKIKGLSSEEYPLIPQVKKENPYSCNVEEFITALGQILFAVSVNESRPEISGAYFKFEKDNLTIASTDSYRLAERKLKIQSSMPDEKEVIIPLRSLQELVRIVNLIISQESSEENEIKIYFEDNQVLFQFNNLELVSRVIEGQFPAYQQIVPVDFKTKAIVKGKELANAIKSSSIFSKTGVYDVSIDVKSNKIKVYSSNNQLGESQVALESKVEGDENRIVLNYKYLLEGLNNLKTDMVLIKLNDPESPCLLKPLEIVDDKEIESQEYLYIIMPIKQ